MKRRLVRCTIRFVQVKVTRAQIGGNSWLEERVWSRTDYFMISADSPDKLSPTILSRLYMSLRGTSRRIGLHDSL